METSLRWISLSFLCLPLVAILVGLVVLVVTLVTRRQRGSGGEPKAEPAHQWARRATQSTALRQCPECGRSMSADAVDGLCPQCLLKGVIGSAHDAARSETGDRTAAYANPSTAPAVADLAPLFPQLEILELIGQGGMGAVYKARQPALDRLVAVKILPPESGRDPAFAERFQREARALARLGHPNIVAIHEVGQAGDLYYIVMEYVDGVNLRQLMRSGHLHPEQALRIIPQICDALQYAHEEGVVHRDVKPENVLLDKKGRVKIADFGLAKLLGRETGNFTLTGSQQVMGTLYYMAPEQIDRPLEVDHRADIYSLGVVFYEMLTGQLPVGNFPPPSEKAGTDPHLDGIVLHALEREPERRYQHASEVKTDVEAPFVRPSVAARVTTAGGRPLARHQLQGPAIALMIAAGAGVLFCALPAFVIIKTNGGWDRITDREMAEMGLWTFVTALFVSLVGGAVVFAGVWKMRRLEAYEFAIITSILALLPVTTLAWPLGFLAGVWSLWILSKPEVRAAFREQLQQSLPTSGPDGRMSSPTDPGRTTP